VYDAFKHFAHSTKAENETDDTHIETLVHDIRDYAKYFCSMALNSEEDADLKKSFHDLRELKVDVAYPFLLELYRDYSSGTLTKEDFNEIVRLVESYVFRRAICNIPTNSMNKTFSTFTKSIDKQNYLESIKAHLLLLPSYRRFPSDEEFYRDVQTRDLYNFRSRTYWLRRFENYGRKEHVPVNEYTIEHVMPQNENLSAEWQKSLGGEWEHIQKTWLHTLGNLTLTGYNSEYSDRPFIDKRDMEGGFKQSPLRLNEDLGKAEDWNESAIQERAKGLAKHAVTVWTSPKLNDEIIKKYQVQPVKQDTYTIDDHPYLSEGSPMYGDGVRKLFDAFRKEVLALDPGVTEEFLKLYVAYKAETNFVDVVPQAKCLRLSLNMKFSEITDPRGVCTDVAGVGRWGNGDVEVKLSSIEELPYVIGLVRQSLEMQLGNGFSE
jgi:predicted transport protein